MRQKLACGNLIRELYRNTNLGQPCKSKALIEKSLSVSSGSLPAKLQEAALQRQKNDRCQKKRIGIATARKGQRLQDDYSSARLQAFFLPSRGNLSGVWWDDMFSLNQKVDLGKQTTDYIWQSVDISWSDPAHQKLSLLCPALTVPSCMVA